MVMALPLAGTTARYLSGSLRRPQRMATNQLWQLLENLRRTGLSAQLAPPAKWEYGDVQMNPINLITDGYERKARLCPALLLVAPLVITVVGVTSVKFSKLESLGAALVGCGGAFLLTQLARDGGKRCEKAFFEKWGGLPSVAVFRYRDIRIDPITKVRYHK